MQQFMQSLRFGTLAAAISAILFVYLPTQIYAGNEGEFTFLFSDASDWLLRVAAGAVVAVMLLGLILPRGLGRFVGTILAILFLGIYFQSGILSWDYGKLDGGNYFGWSDYRGWVDILVWVALAIGVWRFYPKIESLLNWVAVVTTVVLVLAAMNEQTAILAKERQTTQDWKKYTFDAAPTFLFSTSRNAIVVVLDEVQNDIAWDIVLSHPELKNQLEGFTWYRNATSGFRLTATSIPNILTGQAFENTSTFTEYLRLAYRDPSSPLLNMRQRGWEVDLYPWGNERSILADKEIVSNMIPAESNPPISGATLLDYSLFRSAPHVVKGWLFQSGDWFLHKHNRDFFSRDRESTASTPFAHSNYFVGRDEVFRDQLPREFRVEPGAPKFKFYHLNGAHWAWEVEGLGWMLIDDSKVESAFLAKYQGNYDREAKAYRKKVYAALETTFVLLNQLKESDAHANTTVFIVSDHGAGRNKLILSPSHPEDGRDQDFGVFADDLARSIPLFLHKPAGSTGPMKVSDEPIQLSDIGSLLLAELDGDLERRLEEVFERNRRLGRYYRHYKYFAKFQDRLQEFRIYRNRGHSWIIEDWEAVTEEPNSSVP